MCASWSAMSWVIPCAGVETQSNYVNQDERRTGSLLHRFVWNVSSPESVWFISVDYMCILLWTGSWQK